MTEPLALPTELRAWLDGDQILHVEAAQAAVRSYCGWHISPTQTETVVLDGSGGQALMLPSLKVIDVISVIENGTLLDLETFEWSSDGYLYKRYGQWTDRLRGIAVTYRHGFSEVPAEVQAVVFSVAARTEDASQAGAATRVQVGAVSRQYATGPDGQTASVGLSELERAILDRYKLPSRP